MKFTGRFRHKLRFSFRVWPRGTFAINAALREKEWSVDGMTPNTNGKLAVVHRFNNKLFAAFELNDEDAEKLAAVGSANAVLGKMVVHCPGTRFNYEKKECRLEVNVTVYPDASRYRPFHSGKALVLDCAEEEIPDALRRNWDKMHTALVNQVRRNCGAGRKAYADTIEPYAYNGHVILDNPQIADIDIIARHILAGKAVLLDSSVFTGKMARVVKDRLDYYVMPGRDPDEEGGLFMGYQLGGYVFRYRRRKWADFAAHQAEHIKAMHERNHARGQVNRRDVFCRAVFDRIAHKYGISEQRVLMRFLQSGILDYLIRSYEAAAADGRLQIHGDPKHDLQGFVGKAVRVVSFIVDGLDPEEDAA